MTDGKRTYTWKHGRQLATLTQDGKTWTNTYNADGLRVSRTDGTNTYQYYYSDGKLITMLYNGTKLRFAYTPDGLPYYTTYGGNYYIYALNLQCDVVAILNEAGEAVVEYTYDAWGNILSCTGSMANTLGKLNPLRYRGYVYDNETQLYYLQSRYYDPEIGRFINADAFTSTGQGLTGNNMFAYCGNNPVCRSDYGGTRYCEATTVAEESKENRKISCSFQNNIARKSARDVTKEILTALINAANDATIFCSFVDKLIGDNAISDGIAYTRFYGLVDHFADWDIKWPDLWKKTIGTSFPGYGQHVTFSGLPLTPENLGNFTYGFLGYAHGIPYEHLLVGSYYAADFPTSGNKLANELLLDWPLVYLGYETARLGYGG